MRNVGAIDRFFRAFVGVIFLELAVFWLSGTLQIAAYVVGGIFVATVLNHALAGSVGVWLADFIPAAWLPWIIGIVFIAFAGEDQNAHVVSSATDRLSRPWAGVPGNEPLPRPGSRSPPACR